MVKESKCESKIKKINNMKIVKTKKLEIKNRKTHNLKKLNNIISYYITIDNTSQLHKLFDDSIKSELVIPIKILNYTVSIFDIENVKLMKKINNVLDNFFMNQKPIQNIKNPYIFENIGEIVYSSKYIFKRNDNKYFLPIKVLSKKNKDNFHFFIVKV